MCSPSRSFLHIFLFTSIHNLSISLPHSLALSPMYLSPPLSSATFTVTLQTCKPSSSLYLAHSLTLISHPHPLYSLLFWMQPLCLSLSLSLSFFSKLTVTFQTCSRFSVPAAMLTSFISSLALFLSPSLSHHLSLSLSSAMLTHFTIFCCGRHLPPFLSLHLSLFSHTHTLLSSVADTASLCLSSATLTVTLQTRTLPPYLSLRPSLPVPPSPRPSPSLPSSFPLFH